MQLCTRTGAFAENDRLWLVGEGRDQYIGMGGYKQQHLRRGFCQQFGQSILGRQDANPVPVLPCTSNGTMDRS